MQLKKKKRKIMLYVMRSSSLAKTGDRQVCLLLSRRVLHMTEIEVESHLGWLYNRLYLELPDIMMMRMEQNICSLSL